MTIIMILNSLDFLVLFLAKTITAILDNLDLLALFLAIYMYNQDDIDGF